MNVFFTFQIQTTIRMKRKYDRAFKEEVLAWRLATSSTLKETGEHFAIPASTIGSWSSKIQVNIGQVEPEMVDPVLVDEQPQDGDQAQAQVTHDTTQICCMYICMYSILNNRKVPSWLLVASCCGTNNVCTRFT